MGVNANGSYPGGGVNELLGGVYQPLLDLTARKSTFIVRKTPLTVIGPSATGSGS
ncbi:MAG: hypothetical protein NVS4B9_11780 [Ktedonobacteraceae bacterium]